MGFGNEGGSITNNNGGAVKNCFGSGGDPLREHIVREAYLMLVVL